MVGKEEEEDKNFYLSKKTMQLHCNVQCNCIEMFNATALECSMQLHWNVQCNCIGMFNATALEYSMHSHGCPRREATMQLQCSNALHRAIPCIIEKPLGRDINEKIYLGNQACV